MGGSLLRRRSSMASKSAVKFTAMRAPCTSLIDALVAGVEVRGLGLERCNIAIEPAAISLEVSMVTSSRDGDRGAGDVAGSRRRQDKAPRWRCPPARR
jgi:hypothetical protein